MADSSQGIELAAEQTGPGIEEGLRADPARPATSDRNWCQFVFFKKGTDTNFPS
jgi:hypothetical protein